ncbi:hypothetical protein GCK72_021499 [Caenorhabditis remanei]|uniref:F-box domain-containing protein n=1 Tax=Caenorhabditis remanei TaxID=31234 RepID=A0A6A5GJM8_CAERE|nr:hypothetical protein GCK72_021499 [Caenorhabditis remanei]KAF1754934.1 hypothetical protein GCK72_021499 [Caenorhabditis remanei]
MTPFPLLTLPIKILQDVVQNLKVNELITLSILSKRTTILVTPDNFIVDSVKAKIDNHIAWIRFYMNVEYDQPDGLFVMKLNTNAMGSLKFKYITPCWKADRYISNFRTENDNNEEYTWDYAGSSIGNWINHLFTVTKSHIDWISFNNINEIFNLDSMFSIFHHFQNELRMDDNISHNTELRILEKFQPVKRLKFSLAENNQQSLHKIFMQNFDQLVLYDVQNLILDDLLLTNSLSITYSHSNLTCKELNRFLKLWMRHKANRRLEHLAFSNFQGFNERSFFKGLNYITLDDEEERIFENKRFPYSTGFYKIYVYGGFDIMRDDGTRMAIHACSTDLEFFVWN